MDVKRTVFVFDIWRIFSSGLFPGFWISYANVSEYSDCSIFIPARLWWWNRQTVPKCRYIKFRCRGITPKKAYSIQNTSKLWNQEIFPSPLFSKVFAVLMKMSSVDRSHSHCIEYHSLYKYCVDFVFRLQCKNAHWRKITRFYPKIKVELTSQLAIPKFLQFVILSLLCTACGQNCKAIPVHTYYRPKVVRLSALHPCRFNPPGNIPDTNFS